MPGLSALLFVYGGFLVALIASVVGTVVILHFRSKRASKPPAPFAAHVLGMFATAMLAGIAGYYAGVGHYCFGGAGAQCGLGAVFVTGPIAFGIGALAYAAAHAIWDIELS